MKKKKPKKKRPAAKKKLVDPYDRWKKQGGKKPPAPAGRTGGTV